MSFYNSLKSENGEKEIVREPLNDLAEIDRDAPILRAARGALIVFRINHLSTDGTNFHTDIFAGTLIRANRDEGFVIRLLSHEKGQEMSLPMMPGAFNLMAPGDYLLSDNTVARNPDFIAAFDVTYPS